MSEHRNKQRSRTLKTGKIIFNARFSVFECVIRNLSATGAALEVATTVGIPLTFTLAYDGIESGCNVKWRTEKRLGVSFVDQ
jgi:hypothetical protein